MTFRDRPQTEGVGVALGIHLATYTFVFGLFSVFLYWLLQPIKVPNPGLAAYEPPPATVISYQLPARLLVQNGQAPSLAAIESLREEDHTTGQASKVVEHEPERTIVVQKPTAPKPVTPVRDHGSPARDYAAAYPGYSGDRPF